jgi:hypothetical protein
LRGLFWLDCDALGEQRHVVACAAQGAPPCHREIRGGWLRKTGSCSYILHVRATIQRIWRSVIWESKPASAIALLSGLVLSCLWGAFKK